MNIEKFKLLDGGLSGIVFRGTDVAIKEDNASVMMEVEKTYHAPVPEDIVKLIQRLRYFQLKMCGLLPKWTEGFFDDEYRLKDYEKTMDRDWYSLADTVVRMLTVTGFSYKDRGVVITGKITGRDDLVWAINTPLLKMDEMTVGFEDDLVELLGQIKAVVTDFVEDVKFRKMGGKQYLLDLYANDEKQTERVKVMSEEQAEAEQIDKLQKKGFIVFRGDKEMEKIMDMNERDLGKGDELTAKTLDLGTNGGKKDLKVEVIAETLPVVPEPKIPVKNIKPKKEVEKV